jgi:endonuclease YncB( thermonuclease family)
MEARTMMMKRTTIIAALLLALPAAAEPIEPTDVRVIDGDTIHVYGVDPNVRLVGFDTPEIRAAYAEECDLGRRATERLRALVRAGGLDFH